MDIAIVGGGIGGMTTAIALHKIGLKAHVFEQSDSFKPLGAGIGIGSNVIQSLHQLGIGKDILESGKTLKEQRFLNKNLRQLNKIEFTKLKEYFGEVTITIERTKLHQSLYNALDGSYVHFNKKVKNFHQTKNKVSLTFTDESVKKVDYVIAADGIHSIFRKNLVSSSTPRYAGYTCWRGVTKNRGDVSINYSSEAWSNRGRFGFAPLENGDVYWFACINTKQNDTYYKNLNKYGLSAQFSHFSSTVKRLIQDTYEGYFLHHDIYDIKPLDTFIYNRICLLGDAAHATTPNMGQGAGQSIEDAVELMKAIKSKLDMGAAFHHYDKKRVWKTRKVINLSRQIGSVAQWENRLLILFRNTLFPMIPKSLLFRRLTFLFK